MPIVGTPLADSEPQPGHPLRWGVVGTGGIATTVMSDLLRMPDAELVGVCSRSADRGAAFAAGLDLPPQRERPTPRVVTDVAELLPDIDVLYVATPHPQHLDSALPALESGTAVLVEKAITADYDDAVTLVEAARAHRAFLMEAVWMRFSPLHVRARDLIADGELGEVRRVAADFSFPFPKEQTGHRLRDPALGGGALLDMGPYPVSFIDSLLGEPEALAVHGALGSTGVDETVSLLMGYPDGVVGIATCSLALDGPNTATVHGASGAWIEFDRVFLAPPAMTLHRPGRAPLRFEVESEGNGYLPQLREVQARVRAGEIESPIMSHDDTLAQMRVITTALDVLEADYPGKAAG